MLVGIKREINPHDEEDAKLYHIVDASSGRAITFTDISSQMRYFMKKDLPEVNREFLSRLPAEQYLRKIIPTAEFEYIYQEVQSTQDGKLYQERTLWARVEGKGFVLKRIPALAEVFDGNFVDLIMENAVHLGVIKRFIPSRDERGKKEKNSEDELPPPF